MRVDLGESFFYFLVYNMSHVSSFLFTICSSFPVITFVMSQHRLNQLQHFLCLCSDILRNLPIYRQAAGSKDEEQLV